MRLEPEKNSFCAECADIARELDEAYREEVRRNPAASHALHSLIGGTEQDAESAEEFLRPYRYQTDLGLPELPPRLREAMHRSSLHALRTGHFKRFGYR